MSKKISQQVRELITQLESDLPKLLDLSHESLRESALDAFSTELVETILGWYRDSIPGPRVKIPAVMQHLGEAFDVPDCVGHHLKQHGMATRDIAPGDFNILDLYQAVQRISEKAPEAERELRKRGAAQKLRHPLTIWPFQDQGEVVRLEIIGLRRARNFSGAFEPHLGGCREARIFLEEVAPLLDQDPDSVPPLSRKGQTVELPGVAVKVMASKIRIDIDRKTFDWLCEACGVEKSNVA